MDQTIYGFGPFRLHTHIDLMLRGAEPVALGRRAITLLRALVERPGTVVSKDALLEAVWPGQEVEESNLTVQIAALRRVLGTEPGGERWIQTMPRRGYRFVGPVKVQEANGAMASLPPVEAAPDAAPTRQGQAERRQITAMSCELVGVPAAGGGLDLEDLREAVGAFQRCVAETVVRHDGFIARHLGNDLLVLFGYPAAHEDDAEQAVRAGLELCAAVRTLRPGAELPMRCRVGIVTGTVIIGDFVGVGERRDQEIIGDAPNFSARLLASAQPDTVAIGPATRRLIGNLFDCRDLGAIDTTDGLEPMHRWQVLGKSLVESRFEALRGSPLGPVVGRDEEIELLLRRWARAKAGAGQIVLVSGEAGIGKSRIVAALAERLHDEPHLGLRCFCSPHRQDSALYPFIDQLSRAAGFAREDAPAARLEKFETLLARADPPDGDVAFLADLMSLPASERYPLPNLSPQRKKERVLEALIHQLEDLARQQPVVIVFEDAHWIDPTSRELLDLTVERVRRLPVLLIVTFRPEFRPPWIGQPQVTMLALSRLDRHDRIALVEQIAGGKAFPDEVVSRIAEHSDGVPLFLEELTKSVLDGGPLREESDRYVLQRALPPLAIPTSLNAALMARLDGLPSVRHVAQVGAAIGREFSHELLRAVSLLPGGELEAAVASLVASELVFQHGTPPDAVYSFKHALIQDAAHGSLLRGPRQQLHAQIVDALQSHSPEIMEDQPEIFAQHYAEAGLVEKSVDFWGRAGRRSAARSAMAEAAAQFQKGLHELARLPDTLERQRQELEFYSALGAVLGAVKGYGAPEMGHSNARARELWEQLGSPPEFLRIPFGQSRYHATRGEFDLALRLDEDLLRVSRQRGDSAGGVLGHVSSGRNLFFGGRFPASQSHFEEVLALYDPISHRSLFHQTGVNPSVASQYYLGIVLFCLGFPDQALARSNAAIAEALRLAQMSSLALSLAFGARLFSLVGDNAALGKCSDQLVAVATEQGFSQWRSHGAVFRGWVTVKNGDVMEGTSLLRDGLSAFRATGAELWLPHHTALLAGACEIAGQIQEALTLLDESSQIAERTGERWYSAELSRSKGRLLLGQGHTEAAEELYHKALSIAREQEAKLWELRAAKSLARLWGEQGRRAEARDLLAPVYGWFTEGFDTQDLKEAKALLNELT